MEILYKKINEIDDINFNKYMSTIKIEKKNKINKIKKMEDKKRSLQGELLLIKLLHNKNIYYEKLMFYKNKYGKPFIKNKNIFFNISHSNEYAICTLSNNEIGIDIEKVRKINLNIAKQFATSNEIKYINDNDNKSKFLKFFEIYTLKEAYFKCLGLNLNNVLNVEFTINESGVFCSDKNVTVKIIYDLSYYVVSVCEIKRN